MKNVKKKDYGKLTKYLVATFAFIFLLSVPVGADDKKADNQCGEHATWTYDKKTSTVTIQGKGKVSSTKKLKKCKAKKLIIGKGITEIGGYCFYNMNIEQVSIPKTVRKIGYSAFEDTNLKYVKIDATVKKMGGYVFYSCEKLKRVTWNSEDIPYGTFQRCYSLDKIKIGNRVKYISQYAFSSSGIKEIKIPNTVTYIGNNAFRECDNLKTLTIPGSVKNISKNIVADSKNLEKVELKKGVTTLEAGAFENCGAKTVILPNTITTIKKSAFEDADNLEEIDIPNKIKRIPDRAFAKCDKLRTVNLGANIQCIGEQAFSKCKSLGDVIIPGNVREIEYKAFEKSGCKRLIMKNGVRVVDYWAFNKCNELQEVFIPASVTQIENNSFSACQKLTKIHIDAANSRYVSKNNCILTNNESRLLMVGAGFAGTFDIPASVTQIENNAFKGCNKITGFTAKENQNYTSQDGILYDSTKQTLIKCPIRKTGSVIIPYGVLKIGDAAFSESKASYIFIPNTVTQMGYCAFEYCRNLSNITIPGSVERVAIASFWGCKNLKKVTIESGVTRICRNTFQNCKKLKKIVIPSSVTFVNDSAFNTYRIVFYCEKSSAAMAFAVRNDIDYKLI